MKKIVFLFVFFSTFFVGCFPERQQESSAKKAEFAYVGIIIEKPYFYVGYGGVVVLRVESPLVGYEREKIDVLVADRFANAHYQKYVYDSTYFFSVGDTIYFRKIHVSYIPKPSSPTNPSSLPIGILIPKICVKNEPPDEYGRVRVISE